MITTIAFLPSTSEAGAPIKSKPAPEPPQAATVHVLATFSNWNLVGEGDATFSAEYGVAPEGSTSLRISAAEATPRALQQLVPVEPLTEYVFSALVSGDSDADQDSSPALLMGATEAERYDFPASTASWTETTWSYTTAAGETELALSLVATGATNGFRIDDLTMTAAATQANLIANASFETFSAPTQITNSSLIMKTGDALLGLAWQTPSVVWSVADETTTTVASGELQIADGLGLLALGELPQGYYNANLASSDGTIATQQVSFIVLDDPSIPSPTDDRFGVGLHIGAAAYVGSAPSAAQLGFRQARNDAYWSKTELEPGVYTFPDEVDRETAAFANAGVAVLPISVYSNKLYDNGKTPSSPAGISAYVAYTNAVLEHFSPDAIEVYNEFNWLLNTSECGATATCYIQLLQPTAEKIRAEHPGTLVVGPSTAHLDETFMNEFFQAGGLDLIDAVSFHPYDELNIGAETLLPILKQANDSIKEYNNGQSKPIWLTELGWTSGKVGELNQANYLVRGQTIAFANGVERFYWYDLVNDNLDLADGEGNFGLLRQMNEFVPAFAPKPAAMAQAMLARKIADKPFASQDPLDESTFSYVFGAGKSATRVAWATSPTTVSYSTSEPITVTTQFGKTSTLEPSNGRVSVDLTDQAVYLDGDLADAVVTAS
ncbi:glycosyl hydrolase [Leifsonia sp. A12D58]|uniref:glycosyl hydrolase n=1 Tax=Leifsonia sp. A12D58 TaxID=3397674 RepID=UPI0039DF67C3